jgi:guanylate kinase
MTKISKYVDEIIRLGIGYQPSSVILNQLGQTVFVPLIGAFAVGKTATIKAVSQIDPDFGGVHSLTTRRPRAGETSSDFVFLNHNEAGLKRLVKDIKLGSLVQFTVHPTTHYVYGSDIVAYQNQYSMLAMLPEAIPKNIMNSFRSVETIVMVTRPDEWLQRIAERRKVGFDGDLQKRLKEGINNLEWCLNQTSGLNWIDNSGRAIEETAQELISIVKYGQKSNPSVKNVGKQLLATMKSLLDAQLA